MLVQAAHDMDAPVASDKTAIAEKYATANAMDMVLDGAMANEIVSLWHDPAIQRAFENRSKFQLPDSAAHVLENAPRIAAPNYVPQTEDILRCRARTTGIHEILFKVNMFNFRMVDVGGQRSERKKWVHWQVIFLCRFLVSLIALQLSGCDGNLVCGGNEFVRHAALRGREREPDARGHSAV